MKKKQPPVPLSFASAQLHALIESTHDLIWSVDLEYRLTTFNTAYANHILKNFGKVVALGKQPQDLLDTETAAGWHAMFGRALAEGSLHTEYALPDGRWLELSLNPIPYDEAILGISVFGEDITLRKRLKRISSPPSTGQSSFTLRSHGR